MRYAAIMPDGKQYEVEISNGKTLIQIDGAWLPLEQAPIMRPTKKVVGMK